MKPRFYSTSEYIRAGEFFSNRQAAALAEAASKGSLKEIDRLISEGADPNYLGLHEYTPVMWAIRTRSFKGFKQLLTKGGRLDIPNSTALSAMGLAAGPAHTAGFLELALQHGGDPNFRDGATGETPIFQALRSGDENRVRMLIAAGADLNVVSKCETPLIEAATAAEYHSALILLRHGADPKRKNCHGSDFIDFVSKEQSLTWWMPSYWWQKRVLSYLLRADGRG